jgi:oligo-alginate lyase
MVVAEEIEARREEIAGSPDLSAQLERLIEQAQRFLAQQPRVPRWKAQLSIDGGVCPIDGAPLLFDPWHPESHRCSRCGAAVSGERYDCYAARYQHLWLSERIAHLATAGILAAEEALIDAAGSLLRDYAGKYLDFPNRDNVLGPTRLFFSTYLESIWLCNIVAAGHLLREGGALEDATADAVGAMAEEAANLIGEFDEGLSNRQTWNNAALVASAVWFEDEDLARRAIEGRTGLVGHLVDGFGEDGLWYEGENYHLFALRGLLNGLGWARLAGVDLLAEDESRARFAAALQVTGLTALPDFTFPARRDARYGISLAQPMYLELWEVGRARLRAAGDDAAAQPLDSWLSTLYSISAQAAEVFDSYLHEAGFPAPAVRTRSDLSWWTLLEMEANPSVPEPGWDPPSTVIESQGLAVLRDGHGYASVECGTTGGGHGHADRLHLTVHAAGIHWLPDPGTGSYVTSDLFWYRSTLAHNAPRIDGQDQPRSDAQCEAFATADGWSWAKGRFGGTSRTVVSGSGYLVDIVEMDGEVSRTLELPWHPRGVSELKTAGQWEPGLWDEEFISESASLPIQGDQAIALRSRFDDQVLDLYLQGPAELLKARCPALPGKTEEAWVYLEKQQGRYARLVSLLVPGGTAATALDVSADTITVATPGGEHIHRVTPDGWEIQSPKGRVLLRGHRRARGEPLLRLQLEQGLTTARGVAPHLSQPPRLDGTLDGFDLSAPLEFDHDDQYRRSEEPYGGPEEFAAEAWVNWDMGHLYLAVSVQKPELIFRSPDDPPLKLDNENDLIHSDGLQVYFDLTPDESYGFLIVPDPRNDSLTVISAHPETAASVRGAWQRTESGYVVTADIPVTAWKHAAPHETIRFDLLVNQATSGRERRAGQLVWSGGGGWVYLRGDRQDRARFGVLEML